MPSRRRPRWPRDSIQTASSKPGAVQCGAALCLDANFWVTAWWCGEGRVDFENGSPAVVCLVGGWLGWFYSDCVASGLL